MSEAQANKGSCYVCNDARVNLCLLTSTLSISIGHRCESTQGLSHNTRPPLACGHMKLHTTKQFIKPSLIMYLLPIDRPVKSRSQKSVVSIILLMVSCFFHGRSFCSWLARFWHGSQGEAGHVQKNYRHIVVLTIRNLTDQT